MSPSVKPTKLLLLATLLAFGLSACGSSDVPGTLTEDDLPSSVKVDKVTHDEQSGQVVCPDVNNAEDAHVMTPSDNYAKDRRAAVAYQLGGKGHEYVGSSVWRLGHPTEAVAEVAAGLDACVKDQPDVYQRFDVDGYPDALGYTETGADPPVFTRRILIPLSDRVVIVSSKRDGDDDFAVRPDDLVKKAVAASKDAPKP
ncbi:MAG: hypothetical protein QOH68_825 [Nocardioidaceae bacterium]|nr:hypothetical protein [Nocardioidaceae bacterium]